MENYIMSIGFSGKPSPKKADLAYWTSLILVCLSIYVTYRVLGLPPPDSPQEKGEPTTKSQSNLDVPISLLGWTGVDLRLGTPELDLIQPDAYIFRNYSYQDKNVNIYIGYYENLNKADLAHSPLVCYTGGGWTITPRNDLAISKDGNKNYHLKSIIVTKSGNSDLVLYGFTSPDFTTDNRLLLKFRLLLRSLSGASTHNAFVRYSTKLETNELDSKKTLEEFIDTINPYLDAALSDTKQSNLSNDQL